MSKKILLFSDHPDDATFLAEISGKLASGIVVASSAFEAVKKIMADPPHSIFIDVNDLRVLREFENEVQKNIGLFSDLIRPHQVHMISDIELSKIRDVVFSPFFSNYFQRPSEDLHKNGEFYGRFLASVEDAASAELNTLLGADAEIKNVEINHTLQKQEAVEAVRQYLISAKIPARISNMIANAVDELIMNAMFDAPADPFGKTLYSSTARTQERDLKGREKVELSIGFDGFYVGIKVIDHFGSIDRNRLLNYVSSNYKDREYTLKQSQAGAGLGLATVYNSGGSLLYHCEVKNKTEATLIYRTYPSYRDFKNQFKFLSIKFYV